MKILFIFLFLLLISLYQCQPDLAEIKKKLKNRPINLDEIRRSQPVDDEAMTRLLKVDYWFRTETIIYDSIEKKEEAPSTVIAGNFTFETLHHDMEGGMLARMSLTLCKTGNCGNPSPVYVAFQQGGNNIQNVLTNLNENEEASWNFLYAIINTIYTPAEYGEGDTQTVKTVYGRCQVQFGRPEDKRFRRIIDKCNIGSGLNFSRFDGLENVEYNQDVWYTQNTKVDADIIMIDAVELLGFSSQLHEKHGFQLESRTHVEITNRTRIFIEKHCSQDVPATKCAQQAFGATIVGDRLYENVRITPKNPNQLENLIEEYRVHLHDMGDSHICEKHSQLFAKILQQARLAKREDWEAIIKHPENDHVLATIANALGSVGSVESLEIGRDLLLIEAPDHLDDFLFGIAQSPSINEKWHKSLMYWLAKFETNTPEYWKIANTIATVLRRRCEHSTSSLNACNKGKDLVVNKFINELTANGLSAQVFEVLENIPISGSYQLAKKVICTREDAQVQKAALQLILATNKNLYESQLVKTLIQVFRNTCPTLTPTSNSQLAIDILLKFIPDNQNVATLILRTENLNPTDQEKWRYLYKAIEASNEKDELKAELWSRMRKFKVFRPNLLHRALQADSYSHWQQIAESAGFRLFSSASAEFVQKSFKRSSYELSLKKGKKENHLFSLNIDTQNLDNFISKEKLSIGNPEANVRLGIVGHKLPTYSIFKEVGDLLSVVWEADGRTIKAFEGHIPLRDTFFSIPLLSGLSIDVSSVASLSIRLTGSSEVSLWNQKAASKAEASTSGTLLVTGSLYFHQVPIHRIDSSISALSTLSTNTDVLFDSVPYDFCLRASQGKIDISQITKISKIERPRKTSTITRRRILPGATYRQDDTAIQQCNSYFRQIQQ